jgi:hypothetical protein
MKIRQTVLARSLCQVSAIYSTEYRIDVIRRLQERYGFVKVPVTPDELLGADPAQGIRFFHGKFVHAQRTIVIESLQFLALGPSNVIVVDTRTSTEDSDIVVDDYIKNANAIRPDMITPVEPTRYESHIEFTMDGSLTDFCTVPVRQASDALNRLLESYKLKVPPYEPSSINFYFDQVGIGGLLPAVFKIERRAGFRYGANTFYSQAPLKTADHISLLERLAEMRRPN